MILFSFEGPYSPILINELFLLSSLVEASKVIHESWRAK
jgi:hypothetical protein